MKAPTGIIGAGLLFWGWQTGLLPLALVAGILLEGSRLTRVRFELSGKEYYRVWDLCGALFLAAFIISWFTDHPDGVFLPAISWLPIIFLPIMLAQAYGQREKIEPGVFFLMLRNKPGGDLRAINIAFPYLALIICSASAANIRGVFFYAGLIILSAWGLWSIKPERSSSLRWIALFILIASAGYGGAVGLSGLQETLDKKFLEWYTQYIRSEPDPSRASTAIGDIGRVKMTDRIMFRMTRQNGSAGPMLLPRSGYNVYRNSLWLSRKSPYKLVDPEPDGFTWKLSGKQTIGETITIYSIFNQDKAMLTLPNNTGLVGRLPVHTFRKNRMGAVIVDGWPGFAGYRISFGEGFSLNGLPDEHDLMIPKNLDKTLADIATRLNLDSMGPAQKVKAIVDYFEREYSYTLDLRSGMYGAAPLIDFLVNTKAGHCEYFATSATLLLRKTGVPARYVVGYLANEYSWLERMFIVRSRDAHAWTLAYLNGEWINVDATPSTWLEEDARFNSMFNPISDIWSYGMLLITRWRNSDDTTLERFGPFVVAPLILYLLWSLLFQPKIAARRREEKEKGENEGALLNSEFYLIETALGKEGHRRASPETIKSWMKRLKDEDVENINDASLTAAVQIHYALRFDPSGISLKEKQNLESSVTNWLKTHSVIGDEKSK